MRRAASAALLLGFGACSASGPAPPVVLAVAPPVVSPLTATPARVEGRGFLRSANVDLDSRDAPALSKRFVVSIGAVAAEDVTWVDETTIRIVVPKGLPLGLYDVRVTTPAGASGVRANALEVELDGWGGGGMGGSGGVGGAGTSGGGGAGLGGADAGDGGVPCTTSADCVDPCRSAYVCVGGTCSGAVDKDSDGDSHIDAACPGGDDCNDACAVCWTGHPEVCDGFDNDCNGTIDVEGPGAGATCTDGFDNDCDGQTDAYDTDCCVPPPAPVADCAAGFCKIPPGCFVMGSPPSELCRDSDEQQEQVTLTHAFEIGMHEVTQGDYLALMGTNPSGFAACGPTCPVEKVSWYDAAAYCNALSASKNLTPCYDCTSKCTLAPAFAGSAAYSCPGYRLPTEAEWEYAARAGTTAATQAGEIADPSCQDDPPMYAYAFFKPSSSNKSHPVCSLPPNAWGLCDMEGNIGEMVEDGYVALRPSTPVVDPAPVPMSNADNVKGGSWFDPSPIIRYADRYKENPTQTFNTNGFRCVRSL